MVQATDQANFTSAFTDNDASGEKSFRISPDGALNIISDAYLKNLMCIIRRLAYHEKLIAVKLAYSNRGMGGQKYLKGWGIFLRTNGIQ